MRGFAADTERTSFGLRFGSEAVEIVSTARSDLNLSYETPHGSAQPCGVPAPTHGGEGYDVNDSTFDDYFNSLLDTPAEVLVQVRVDFFLQRAPEGPHRESEFYPHVNEISVYFQCACDTRSPNEECIALPMGFHTVLDTQVIGHAVCCCPRRFESEMVGSYDVDVSHRWAKG